jgi:transcriptional regulator with XRE-family HTH domain
VYHPKVHKKIFWKQGEKIHPIKFSFMSSDLKLFRKSPGLSQGQLAELLGISKSTISMVENERRELPGAASKKLDALRQQNHATTGNPGLAPGLTFQDLKEDHMRESEDYLLSYKKDCEFALHKYEKRVSEWTKQYEKAATQLFVAVRVVREAANQIPMDENSMLRYERQRIEATETLSAISQQKPEIVMIKIAGLKQELRSIKAMLGKQKRYLGMKEIGLFPPGQIPSG